MFNNLLAFAHRADGRHSARRLVLAVAAASTLLAATLAAGAEQEAVSVDEHRGTYTVRASFTVPQPPAEVLATLTDYDQIPRFMPDVKTSTVLERNERLTVVEQEAVARFMMFSRRMHLILEVQEEAGMLSFRDRCGKSFGRYEGAWTIEERDGRTEVGYLLIAAPSFDVPEFLLKRLLKRDSSEMIDRLKKEMAARAGR